MDGEITTLDDVHRLPWAAIEGATLRVRQELQPHPAPIGDQPATETVERQGDVVGRRAGSGLHYDSAREQTVVTHTGPRLYLETPQDTVVEICTDKPANELLAAGGINAGDHDDDTDDDTDDGTGTETETHTPTNA